MLTSRRSKSKPWFTKEAHRIARRREHAYATYKRNPSSFKKEELKRATTELKRARKQSEDAYVGSLILRMKERPKEFWNFIKMNRKDEISIPSLDHDGTVVHDSAAKANCFNSFFWVGIWEVLS